MYISTSDFFPSLRKIKHKQRQKHSTVYFTLIQSLLLNLFSDVFFLIFFSVFVRFSFKLYQDNIMNSHAKKVLTTFVEPLNNDKCHDVFNIPMYSDFNRGIMNILWMVLKHGRFK